MQIYKISLGKYELSTGKYTDIVELYATSLMNAYDMATELFGQLLQGCKLNNLTIKMDGCSFDANDYNVVIEIVGMNLAFGVDIGVIDRFDTNPINYATEMHFDL